MRIIKRPGLGKARAFKRAGGTKQQYLQIVSDSIRKAGAERGWRPSEVAMSIAAKMQIADIVWKEGTK